MRDRPVSAGLDRGKAVAATRGVRRWVSPGWQLTACPSMHVVNDALFVGLYPLLPLVAADLSLSYAEVGAIKTAYSGASAVLQVPAGIAAERWGEHLLLALGTGWLGLGLAVMAFAAAFWPLLALSLLGGLGGNVQHPVASSVVSRLFESGRRPTAIGTLSLYYTCTLLASALAPILYGLLADRAGLGPTFATLAAVTASIAPLALLVGRGLRTDLSH